MAGDKAIEAAIRTVPDFPKPGVLFYDITGILADPRAFAYCIERMEDLYRDTPLDGVAYWAAESSDYDYATNTCAPGQVCGHYTQMVWRSTSNIGCALHLASAELSGRQIQVLHPIELIARQLMNE